MKDFSGEGVYHETLPQHFKKIAHSHSTRFIKYSVVQNRIIINCVYGINFGVLNKKY